MTLTSLSSQLNLICSISISSHARLFITHGLFLLFPDISFRIGYTSYIVAKNSSFPIIPDSINVFDRAYNDFDLFQSYEEAGAFFVTKAKENLRFELLGQQDLPKKKGLQFDQIVQIRDPKQRKKYPEKLSYLSNGLSKT
ncbi:MAG: hypothetical protein GY730_07585 [bacterium]|nr:hypothetical protein [bacterium]